MATDLGLDDNGDSGGQSSPLEYTVEASSREEGVELPVLLPSVSSPPSLKHGGGNREEGVELPIVLPSVSSPPSLERGGGDGTVVDTVVDTPSSEDVAGTVPAAEDKVAAASGGSSGSNLEPSASDCSNADNNANSNSNENSNSNIGSGDRTDALNIGDDLGPPEVAYYTAPPRRRSFLPSPLSFRQRLREYRHSTCLMTPASALVLAALLVSSALTLLLTFPQLVVGVLLGPLLRRNFWLVEFLYRFGVAKWGHLKIMEMAERSKKGQSKSQKGSDGSKTPPGHSATLRQRITVVPGRVFVHPIPQFTDNIAYLIVCTPPPDAAALPLVAILIDCGQASTILRHMEKIYEEFYIRDYPRKNRNARRMSLGAEEDITDSVRKVQANYRANERVGMELHAILCTHRHHDHTAGVFELKTELADMRREESGMLTVDAGEGCGSVPGDCDGSDASDVYRRAPGKVLVVGGAVEEVPHCDLFVKNGCFVPLPCISIGDAADSVTRMKNDMNAVVSLEAIGVPSHTRGSVVYALRNRVAPGVARGPPEEAPLQSHLFTGDAVFTGGCGVPFEADLENASDNVTKSQKRLKAKHGGSSFRPGAGTLSVERCFAEVLSRARGPWSDTMTSSSTAPQALTKPQLPLSPPPPASTMLYPGHDYTTDLLLRQFDPRSVPLDGKWPRLPPAAFFATASHYFVSAHRRALPPGQKMPTTPTPLETEVLVNPNFRSLKRRGEGVVNALRLWYEFGAQTSISVATVLDGSKGGRVAEAGQEDERNVTQPRSVFTTVYSADLDGIVEDLRRGQAAPADIAARLEALPRRLEERVIGRRPIPGTLPSHKTVYLGVLALAVLGAAPSAATVSDAAIMDLEPPVENADRLLVSRGRLIAVLDGLGLLSDGATPRLQDIIHLLWWEAGLDDGGQPRREIARPDASKDDVERSLCASDRIELGLLKLALFGVACRQPSKFCLPCGGGTPRYDEGSWVTTSKIRRTGGELVRHDPETCPLCRDVLRRCPYSAAS